MRRSLPFVLIAFVIVAASLPLPAAAAPEPINGPMAVGYTVDPESVQISPDSARVIFVGDLTTRQVFELYMTPVAGGPQLKLSPELADGARVSFAKFSPIGTRVVLRTDAALPGRYDLWSVPSDGSAPAVKITSAAHGVGVGDFIFSQAGSTVIFRQQRPPIIGESSSRYDLWSVPADGSAAPVLIHAPLPNSGSIQGDYQASSDIPPRVVYRGDATTAGKTEIYSRDFDGGNAWVLLAGLPADGDVTGFKLSSANRVALRADRDIDDVFELFTVPAAGGASIKVHPNLVANRSVEPDFKFTPGGSRIVYRSDQDVNNRLELWSSTAAGLGNVKINPDLGMNRDVTKFEVSGARAVYVADQDTPDVFELFAADNNAAATDVVKLSGILPAGGEVIDMQIGPGATYVIYRANVVDTTQIALFSRQTNGGGANVQLSPVVAGIISTPYRITNAGRVLFVFTDTAGNRSLFSNSQTGGVNAAIANIFNPGGTVDYDFAVSVDSARVVYTANISSQSREVWSRSASALGDPVKLTASTAIGGSMSTFLTNRGGTRILYSATERDYAFRQLYLRQLGGSPAAIFSEAVPVGFQVQGYGLSPDEQTVVYTAGKTDTTLIFSRPFEASSPSLALIPALPAGQRIVSCCQFSPNSQRIAYLQESGPGGSFELYTVPVAGGPPVKINGALPAGGSISSIVGFTGDSSRIVFYGDGTTSDLFELYSAPADGSGPVVTLNPPPVLNGDAFSPARLTPDGTRVIFRGDIEIDGKLELYVVPVGGGAVTKLNTVLGAGGGVSDWESTSDSASVVYRARTGAATPIELFVVPIGGGASLKLSGPIVAGGNLQFYAISPDNRRVVFTADAAIVGVEELYSVPIDASAPPVRLHDPLVAGQAIESFRIAPNGTQVVYRIDVGASDQIQLFRTPIGGGPTVVLNGPLQPNGSVLNFQIDPTSKRVIYRADQETDGVDELYAVALVPNLALPAPVKISEVPVTRGDVTDDVALASSGLVRFTATGSVIYAGDLITNNVFEIFSTDKGNIATLQVPISAVGSQAGW